MTDYENTQHRPSTSETDQAYESKWIATMRKRGARFLELTKGALHTARMIHRHGLPPLPPYKKERQPATPEEMSVLNGVLSTVAARAKASNAASTHTAARNSIDFSHHEAALTHKDNAQPPKTGIHSDGEPI